MTVTYLVEALIAWDRFFGASGKKAAGEVVESFVFSVVLELVLGAVAAERGCWW